MEDLERITRQTRRHVLEMAYHASDSHIGCALSAMDILAALYFRVMKINPDSPKSPGRDRFILSKGHTAAALYAVLSARGFFPKTDLDSFAQNGSHLASHVERNSVPGVETNGGSGGHGLPLGAGMALALRESKFNAHVFVLMGDGELQEGSVWEAAMFASSRNLSNLTLIVDRNAFQTWSKVDDVVTIEPLADKFRMFGWSAEEVDGHDIERLIDALSRTDSRPRVIIAKTTKGKGVSFMEGSADWHNGVLSEAQYRAAIEELA